VDNNTMTDTVPAMVSRDLDTKAQARHSQLPVSNGEMVLVGGKLESGTRVVALDMDDGRRGWISGGMLQALQAAVVLEPVDARAGSEGPQPKVTAFRGHTVWVSSRNDSGWIFVRSQGREGWIPAGALLGNATGTPTGNTMIVFPASGVHAGILVVGLVGMTLAACSIVAVFAYDASSRQRMAGTLQIDTPHGEVHADVSDETQDRPVATCPKLLWRLWQPPPQAAGSPRIIQSLQLQSVAKRPGCPWMPFRSTMQYLRRKQEVFLPLSQGP
jgi:hypothetical protein